MRSRGITRSVWIDCICIDQNNDCEKRHQVSLMAEIFQSSFWTLAHSSADDDDGIAERAFDHFSMMNEALREAT